ncbi:hypothetical protein Y1Q_0001110 [Alligator mississippiensis]|uniref:Uncharacterized protein n=1 Tax=Alligator mississippiensis TaxID=8496 RepID=A0A151M3V7_ALLMI|nr:hypothetical protein Y1Q_0001110 [Alligator mississippiensis]
MAGAQEQVLGRRETRSCSGHTPNNSGRRLRTSQAEQGGTSCYLGTSKRVNLDQQINPSRRGNKKQVKDEG